MAFKMKGYQAHSKSPMKKGGLWDNIKSGVGKAAEYVKDKAGEFKDKTINLGLTGQDYKDRQDFNRRERERTQGYIDESKKRMERSNKRHEGLIKSYEVYGNRADQKKNREAYADKYMKDYYKRMNTKDFRGNLGGMDKGSHAAK
jgi:hypothetical protein